MPRLGRGGSMLSTRLACLLPRSISCSEQHVLDEWTQPELRTAPLWTVGHEGPLLSDIHPREETLRYCSSKVHERHYYRDEAPGSKSLDRSRLDPIQDLLAGSLGSGQE